jgi:hypothetical protein
MACLQVKKWTLPPVQLPVENFAMNPRKNLRILLSILGLLVFLPTLAFAEEKPRDGSRDFDFELGTWKTHLKRRLRPLTGSNTWVEMEGITTVRKVWDGKGIILELVADGAGAHFEGLSLRLYNPQTRQWSLNFANAADGQLAPPTIGEFKDGRGEFYAQETLNGRAIFVRFVISDITPNSIHFEQAFSDDGGKTWEVNWIANDTRIVEEQ